MSVFKAVLMRDLQVAFRRWSELAHPLIFFIIVVVVLVWAFLQIFPVLIAPFT